MESYSKSGLWMIHSYQRDQIQWRRWIPSAGSRHIHQQCSFLTGWGGPTTSCQQFLQGDTFLSDNKLWHVAALTGTRNRSPSDLSHKLCPANWINYRSAWVLLSRGLDSNKHTRTAFFCFLDQDNWLHVSSGGGWGSVVGAQSRRRSDEDILSHVRGKTIWRTDYVPHQTAVY